jgi:hypothetical protein
MIFHYGLFSSLDLIELVFAKKTGLSNTLKPLIEGKMQNHRCTVVGSPAGALGEGRGRGVIVFFWSNLFEGGKGVHEVVS